MFLVRRKGSDFEASPLAFLLFLIGIMLFLTGLLLWLYNGLIALAGVLFLIAGFWKGIKEEIEYEIKSNPGLKEQRKENQELEKEIEQLKQQEIEAWERYYDKTIEKEQLLQQLKQRKNEK